MPYKDRVSRKEANKKANQRYRDRHKGITQGITKEGITEQGITEYQPIVYALADPVKRAKLKAICESLRPQNLDDLYYGCVNPASFSQIKELLKAFD